MVSINFLKSISTTVFVFLLMIMNQPVQAQYWEEGFVLLTNDRIMSGRIEQQGDLYSIRQNEGNQIRIPKAQIAVIANSLQDLYQYKKKSLPAYARTGDHIKLARWCIASNLLAEAGEHYLLLARVAPPAENPSIRQLGEEIKSKMLQQNDFRIALGKAPLGPVASAVAFPKQTSTVVTASSNATADLSMVSARAHLRFTEKIQHILVNRCGQAACHGAGSTTPFRLLEVGGADAAGRTRANIESVLKYISTDPKAKSALLDYMARSHGNMRSPAISSRDTNLALEVTNWVQMIQSPVVTAEAIQQPSQLNPLAPGAPQLRQVPHATGPSANGQPIDGEFPHGLGLPSSAELDALEAQIGQSNQPLQVTPTGPTQQPAKYPPPLNSTTPIDLTNDPFDPAEFNRQAGKRKQ